MLEILLSVLGEFGLIREDYKHRKKVKAKENEDGVKRPFQRYFLQPSTLIFLFLLLFTIIASFVFFRYQNNSIYPEKTRKELVEINVWTEKWIESYGRFPTDLNEIIGKNPIMQDWKKDAWNRSYKYKKTKNKKGFSIISAGFDGQFETEDDIKLE
ncbi:hypothetical protein FG167_16035 [Lacinutrix sp. WUR7]|uniref:type II secretion system protein GspG n=1 Tax=Lacinutrix sp. WUR7 TaxID=2653681 RepID=UPI00193D99CB|nr:type II secretion system protein GspG [Lacinutrix sp. WUR7]QRM90681.1 hypothetical protein FG167_16035 [Lacinutrix sp. WUR7]